jgi:phosphoribosylformylglycinamidine synthase
MQFTATGIVGDVLKSQTMEAKFSGDLVYLLGVTRNELGGSAYYDLFGYTGLNVPQVEGFDGPNRLEPGKFEPIASLYRAVEKAICSGIFASCHGIYRGGLGVHVAMTAIGGRCGLTIDLAKVPDAGDGGIRDDQLLFSESCGRFLVTVPKEGRKEFESIFDGLPHGLVGEVTENPELVIKGKSGKELLRENVFSLRRSWAGDD